MSELVDSPEIAERKADRIETKAAEDAVGLTIAERLTRRAKEQTVELMLQDAAGTFAIVMQQPTRAEMEEMQRMQELITQEDTYDEANDTLCGTLSDLCLDDSLDYEFWQNGNYSMSDLMDVVNKLFESIAVRVKAAQSFRKN